MTLEGTMALATASNPGPGIYRVDTREAKAVQVTAIPHYANLNRGPVEMTVWMPLQA